MYAADPNITCVFAKCEGRARSWFELQRYSCWLSTLISIYIIEERYRIFKVSLYESGICAKLRALSNRR